MARFIGYLVLALVALLTGLVIASQLIRPEHLHDFESDDFYKTSAQQTSPGDTGLLVDFTFEQALGGDLSGVQSLDVHVYPNVLPQIRRYGWYPYREEDRLTVTPTWSPDVISVTVNGEPHVPADPIKLSGQDHGQETLITAETAGGARSASYVILTLPHTFPPLKTTVHSVDEVAPGVITGLQATLTTQPLVGAASSRIFCIPKACSAHWHNCASQGCNPLTISQRAKSASIWTMRTGFTCPFVNFALDKFGTPLKYNNAALGPFFYPSQRQKPKDYCRSRVLSFKENVMDSDENFAEAITRSFTSPKGEATKTEIPRHIPQFRRRSPH